MFVQLSLLKWSQAKRPKLRENRSMKDSSDSVGEFAVKRILGSKCCRLIRLDIESTSFLVFEMKIEAILASNWPRHVVQPVLFHSLLIRGVFYGRISKPDKGL